MKIEVDDDFLKRIEDAVASGAVFNTEIAKVIGVNVPAFENILYGRRKDGEREKSVINEAIKKGMKRQPGNIIRVAELSLLKKIQGYTQRVVSKEVRTFKYEQIEVPRYDKNGNEYTVWDFKRDEKGQKIPVLDEEGNHEWEITTMELKDHVVTPSDPAIFFALDNLSRRLDKGQERRWTNKDVIDALKDKIGKGVIKIGFPEEKATDE